jgi:hypothetical protein
MTTEEYIDKAISKAMQAVNRGRKCVMILFPSTQWVSDAIQGHIAVDTVYYRAANVHSGLMMLPVDCLILVNYENLDPVGVEFAKNRMHAQRDAELIVIDKQNNERLV